MGIPQFWRLTSQNYKLVGEVCTRCGNAIFPPRDLCPECHRPAYDLPESEHRQAHLSDTVFDDSPGYIIYALDTAVQSRVEEIIPA